MRALFLVTSMLAGCQTAEPTVGTSCVDDQSCDDGLFCNGLERCMPEATDADARGCIGGRPPITPSEDPCMIVECDETRGSVLLRRAPSCAAPDPEPERDGGCRTDGECDDGVACTRDACAPDGTCTAAPDHSVCVDDDACDGVERCEPLAPDADAQGCLPGTPPTPPPGPDCTEVVCDPATGTMIRTPTAACACDTPGSPCEDPNVDDCRVFVCAADLSCVQRTAPQGTACDDDVACTVQDACDAEGTCTGAGSDPLCDDGRFCNGPEFCDGGCVQGAAPIRSDGLDCTEDLCDEDTDSFRHVPGPDCACERDADCTPAEPIACLIYRCDADRVCQVAPSPAGDPCTDGVACTAPDACDGAGGCAGRPDDGACDDRRWCTGIERCRPAHPNADANGCRRGPAPSIGDGIDCTDDGCDECDPDDPACVVGQSGRRVHVPTERCECRGDAECPAPEEPVCRTGVCDLATWTCEEAATPPGTLCDDSIACTAETFCDAAGRCAGGLKDHASCDDGLWCTGEERCNPARFDPVGPLAQGCAAGVDPRRDHPGRRPCAVLSCDEEIDAVLVDEDQCIDCLDVEVFADEDGDEWGVADDSHLACLEPDEELDGFSRRADDCEPDDPLRSPGSEDICADWVDDDCDGEDLVCPESQPAAGELPNWDCITGTPPLMVLAWAFFEEGGAVYEPGMCFVFFEAYPGEFFVTRANARPLNPEHICPPHPDGTSTNPSLYAHTVVGPTQDCPLMELEINYDIEILRQPVSTQCRKYVAQIESLGEFAFISADEAELRRRLTLASTLELSCSRLTGQEDLPGHRLLSAPIQFSRLFEPL